jgi:hypothetical protein
MVGDEKKEKIESYRGTSTEVYVNVCCWRKLRKRLNFEIFVVQYCTEISYDVRRFLRTDAWRPEQMSGPMKMNQGSNILTLVTSQLQTMFLAFFFLLMIASNCATILWTSFLCVPL